MKCAVQEVYHVDELFIENFPGGTLGPNMVELGQLWNDLPQDEEAIALERGNSIE